MSLYQELKRRNVVRVAVAYLALAWLLIEVCGTVFPGFGIPEWGFRLVVLLLALGFIPTVIFSWVYEITPEGLKREREVERDESITHLTARHLDWVTIGMVVAAVAFSVAEPFTLPPDLAPQSLVPVVAGRDDAQVPEPLTAQPPPPLNSIAVLPFVDLSPQGDQEYFSDGMSEEILNALAHVPELRVISRSSAFSFKGKSVPISTIAKQLGVASVIEGSVRKAGKRIRVTAQLIDASTDLHLWSETYDRELEDIFAVQDEISAAVVVALRQQLGLVIHSAPRVTATANLEAHDAYLRATYLMYGRTNAGLARAVKELGKALTLDPDYALAHAELAVARLLQGYYGVLTETEAIALATPHAERAMALAPTLAEAQAAQGFLLYNQWKLEQALEHFRQAIEINPNYSAVYMWMGNTYSQLGRYKEGFASTKKAAALDPRSMPAVYNYFYGLVKSNRLTEADRELENLVSIASRNTIIYARGNRDSLGGKWSEQVLSNLEMLRGGPEETAADDRLPWLFAAIGLEKEALTISDRPSSVAPRWLGRPAQAVTIAQARVVEDPESLITRQELGLALAGAGDYRRARPLLEEMWRKNSNRVTLNYDLFGVQSAAALIVMRRSDGEAQTALELLAAIRDNARRYRDAGWTTSISFDLSADYEEGLALYLSGAHEKGLALITRAVEDGYFMPQQEAYLQQLYDDPGFAPVRAMHEARQTRERERFLAIVCRNNPYADYWHPAEGSCERFASSR
jgi:TolB-like protein/Tfp pilus assembly protein PilF